MGAAERMTFHEWIAHRNDVFFNLTTGWNSRNPERWRADDHDGNVYTWRPDQPGEQVYDFNPYFPADNGRPTVDRKEGYLFALYEHRGGTGGFVPFGDPEDDEDA